MRAKKITTVIILCSAFLLLFVCSNLFFFNSDADVFESIPSTEQQNTNELQQMQEIIQDSSPDLESNQEIENAMMAGINDTTEQMEQTDKDQEEDAGDPENKTLANKADSKEEYVADEVLVIFKDGVSQTAAQDALSTVAEDAQADVDTDSLNVVNVSSDITVDDAVKSLEDNPDVAYVQPNYVYRLLEVEEEAADETGDTEESAVVKENTAAEDGTVTEKSAAAEEDTETEESAETEENAAAEANTEITEDAQTDTNEEAEESTEAQTDETTADDGTGLAETMATINDPYASSDQWYLSSIDAYDAWDISQVSKTVRVAVIDTGVDITHEDLVDNLNLSLSYDEVNDTSLSGDMAYHGTHVAGIIAAEANNGIGVAGVSYNAEIIAINVFEWYYDSISDSMKLGASTSDIIDAIYRAVSSDASVINMSLGGYGSSDTALETAVNYAVSKGVVVVCAGGNGDDYGNPITSRIYPGDYDACISVVPLNSSNVRPAWADYNTYKDISAPGVSIYSTVPDTYGSYEDLTGSSMASPVVAGVAALLMAEDSSLSVSQVKAILYDTATDLGAAGKDNYYGYGKVDAYAAAQAAADLSASSITVVPNDSVYTVTEGSTKQMAATVLPVYAADRTVTWSVTAITGSATISQNGLLTGTQVGTVKVRATANDSSGVYGEATMTVIEPVGVGSITLSSFDGTYTVSKSKTKQMMATVLPTNATDRTVTWSVTAITGGATITQSGLLTGTKVGTVKVRATANDSSGVYGEKTITVLGVDTSAPTATKAYTSAGSSTTVSSTVNLEVSGVVDATGVQNVLFLVYNYTQGHASDVWISGVGLGGNKWGALAEMSDWSYAAGTYIVDVFATDTLGNFGYIATTQFKYTKDTSAPTATKAYTSAGSSTVGGQTVTLEVSGVSDSSGVSNVQFLVYNYTNGGHSTDKWISGVELGDNKWGATAHLINWVYTPGLYIVDVFATDTLGNFGYIATTQFKYTKDTSAPTATKAYTSAGSTTTTSSNVNLEASGVTDPSGVSNVWFLVYNYTNGGHTTDQWFNGVSLGSNKWGAIATMSDWDYSAGTYIVDVFGTDSMGNFGYIATTQFKYTKDTSAPTATKAYTSAGSTTTTSSNVNLEVSGVTDPSGVSSVQFLVYNYTNGGHTTDQWISGVSLGSNKWGAIATMSRWGNSAGTYIVDVFGTDSMGNFGYIATTQFKYAPSSSLSILAEDFLENTAGDPVSEEPDSEASEEVSDDADGATDDGLGDDADGATDDELSDDADGATDDGLGDDADGATDDEVSDDADSATDDEVQGYEIMGSSLITAQQLQDLFIQYQTANPCVDETGAYGEDGVPTYYGVTLEQFIQTYINEATQEGVKPEVAFAMAMLETDYLRYTGTAGIETYNFAGLTDETGELIAFGDLQTGIRVQVQHIKCYASTDACVNAVVDPKWSDSFRGTALSVEEISAVFSSVSGHNVDALSAILASFAAGE